MNLLGLNTTRKASIKFKRMLAATFDELRGELLGVWHKDLIALHARVVCAFPRSAPPCPQMTG